MKNEQNSSIISFIKEKLAEEKKKRSVVKRFKQMEKSKEDSIDYINSVYKGHSLSLTTDNYSIQASIYPDGCDFSVKNNKDLEIAGWNDIGYHYTSMDCLAEFEIPEKKREELRTAIKKLGT